MSASNSVSHSELARLARLAREPDPAEPDLEHWRRLVLFAPVGLDGLLHVHTVSVTIAEQDIPDAVRFLGRVYARPKRPTGRPTRADARHNANTRSIRYVDVGPVAKYCRARDLDRIPSGPYGRQG